MDYEFLYSEDFLIIRLSGIAGVNERLSVKDHLNKHVSQSFQKVIVDLEGVDESGGVYILGVLSTIKKEFQLWGGEIKLCSLRPELYRYFQENRLDQIFDIGQSIEETKSKYRRKREEK